VRLDSTIILGRSGKSPEPDASGKAQAAARITRAITGELRQVMPKLATSVAAFGNKLVTGNGHCGYLRTNLLLYAAGKCG
jgi:hypothetical protein